MRAILVCTAIPSLSKPERDGLCSPLAPLLDRPFLHHVIECIMDLGVREIHFVLHGGSELLHPLLGTGQRWGGAFVYHDLAAGRPVYSQLGSLLASGAKDEVILVAHADRLPVIDRKLIDKPVSPTFLLGTEEAQESTGWAFVTHEMLMQVPGDADEYGCLAKWREHARVSARVYRMPEPLGARTFSDLLAAHSRVLTKRHAGLVLTGREVRDRVWIGRNVRVHRTAKLLAPVYVAENCRIGPNVQLGPGTSIGKGSVVDRFSVIENSVVYPGSYVGEGLEVRDAIVRGSHLVNTRIGAELHDVDDILLGEVQGLQLGRWADGLRDWSVAAVIALAVSPVLAGLILWKAVRWGVVPLEAKEFVLQPTVRHPERWRTSRQWTFRTGAGTPPPAGVRAHFVNAFLPGLWNVLRGELALVGEAPIAPADALVLSEGERAKRLKAKAGLIHPQVIECVPADGGRKSTQSVLGRYLSALSAGIPAA